MDRIGCLVTNSNGQLPEYAQWQRFIQFRRIGKVENSLELAVLIGLLDCGKFAQIPIEHLIFQGQDTKLTNLVTFLKSNGSFLLNHNSFKYFEEIPHLLESAAGQLKQTAMGGYPYQEKDQALFAYCDAFNVKVTLLERPRMAIESADFVIGVRKGHFFNLYPRECENPKVLCCGCQYNMEVALVHGRLQRDIFDCPHHSLGDLQKLLLLQAPMNCELEFEGEVLTGGVYQKCQNCGKRGFRFRVEAFCPNNCEMCKDCARLIFQKPVFYCPNCGSMCFSGKYQEMHDEIFREKPSILRYGKKTIDQSQFPLCGSCHRELQCQPFTWFNSVHSTCNVCLDCFYNLVSLGNYLCPACGHKLEETAVELVKQMKEKWTNACNLCLSGHTCSQPPCYLCECGVGYLTSHKSHQCPQCGKSLCDKSHHNWTQVECGYQCLACIEKQRLVNQPAAPVIQVIEALCELCNRPTQLFPECIRIGRSVCVTCYQSLLESQIQCVDCHTFKPMAYFAYRSKCMKHEVCYECAFKTVKVLNGTGNCKNCNPLNPRPPPSQNLCANCKKRIKAVNVHKDTECHFCWDCALTSFHNNPLERCEACRNFYTDTFLEAALSEFGWFCSRCQRPNFLVAFCCNRRFCKTCYKISSQCEICHLSPMPLDENMTSRIDTQSPYCRACLSREADAELIPLGEFYYHQKCATHLLVR